jgi:Domain of unknown function (DUF5667)
MSKRERLLEERLDRSLAGSRDVEGDPLKDEPGQNAAEIQPLIEAAAELRRALPRLEPRAAFVRQLESRLWNRLQSRRSSAQARRVLRQPWLVRALPTLLGAALVAALALGSLGVAQASAAALPGDRLYSVKRGFEELRLALTLDPLSDADLLGEFADERLNEIESLAAAGRMDDLGTALDGYVVAVGRLAGAVTIPTSGGADQVLDKLTHHISVLEEVQMHVPEPAQAAIERVIERSIEAETSGRPETATPIPGEEDCGAGASPCDQGGGVEDQDVRMAGQIAKIYGVPSAQVMTVFRGECQMDWKCVRAHFRTAKPKNPHRP